MKVKQLAKPYMKWFNQGITGAKHLYKELIDSFPEVDAKINSSTLDEHITTEKSIDGKTLKETYFLKASKNGQKFQYKHELSDNEDINDIRDKAWVQKEAWEYSIEQTNLNKIEDGNKEIKQC
jgi:hypothetical protein